MLRDDCEKDILFLPLLRDGSVHEDVHRYNNVPLLNQMVYWGDFDADYVKAMQRPHPPTTRREHVDTPSFPTSAANANIFVPEY